MKRYIILLVIVLACTYAIMKLGGAPFGHNVKFLFNFFYGFFAVLLSRRFSNKIAYYSITLIPPIVISFLILSTINWQFYSLAVPSTAALFLGIMVGLAVHISKSKMSFYVLFGLSLVFNVFVLVNGYNIWVHKLNYGTYTGKQLISVANPSLKSDEIGTEIKLDKPEQIYLLSFWTNYCGVCIEEFPEVQSVYEKYHEEKPNLSMYLVTVPNYAGDAARSEEILRENKVTVPQLYFTGSREERESKYRVFAYPTVLIIKNNEIIHIGSIQSASRRLKELL